MNGSHSELKYIIIGHYFIILKVSQCYFAIKISGGHYFVIFPIIIIFEKKNHWIMVMPLFSHFHLLAWSSYGWVHKKLILCKSYSLVQKQNRSRTGFNIFHDEMQ